MNPQSIPAPIMQAKNRYRYKLLEGLCACLNYCTNTALLYLLAYKICDNVSGMDVDGDEGCDDIAV